MLSEVRGAKLWYSAYPEFYMPMCFKCHRARDASFAAAELREYREWKLATRMTVADIAIVKTGAPGGR